MAKLSAEKRDDAIKSLRKILKPGDTVYTVLRSVAKSGMSRMIDVYVIRKNEPVWLTGYCVPLGLGTQTMAQWQRSAGMKVDGVGLDIGFHVVYNLGRTLFPKGFKVKGRGRNGDTSGHDNDGGYALTHRWL